MNDKLVTTGLVIRDLPSKDSNSLLTILTAQDGLVNAAAYGARKSGGSLSSGTKLFNYSEFTLIENRGRYKVDRVRSIEQFFELSKSVEALSAASYFMQLLYDVSITGERDIGNLRLALNALFALAREKYPVEQVKAVFELRLMAQSGFEPELDCCAACGGEDVGYFSLTDGCLFCDNCAAPRLHNGEALISLLPGTADALRYIIAADMAKLFAFRLKKEELYNLADLCEAYTRVQTDKSYSSLEIYHSLIDIQRKI